MSITNIALLFFAALGVAYVVFIKLFIRSSKHIHSLNTDDFEKHLAATKEALLIDARTPREFKKYRIAGAINIDYLNVNFHREIKKLDKTKPVMVYCHSGYRSKMALPNFCKAGFKTIYELDTGFSGWLKAGKTVETAKSRSDDTLLTVDAIYGQNETHHSSKSRRDDTLLSTPTTKIP